MTSLKATIDVLPLDFSTGSSGSSDLTKKKTSAASSSSSPDQPLPSNGNALDISFQKALHESETVSKIAPRRGQEWALLLSMAAGDPPPYSRDDDVDGLTEPVGGGWDDSAPNKRYKPGEVERPSASSSFLALSTSGGSIGSTDPPRIPPVQ